MSDQPQVSEPRGLETIPGLGLVRIRCLRKAGMETVESLLSASVDQIAAIPGIGESKARQIVQYLTEQAAAARNPKANGTARRKHKALAASALNSESAHESSTAVDEIALVSKLATDLLSAPISHCFGRGLARQVGRVALLGEADGASTSIKPRRIKAVQKDLAKLKSLLIWIAHQEDLGKKRQDRTSDELRERRRRVQRAIRTADSSSDPQ